MHCFFVQLLKSINEYSKELQSLKQKMMTLVWQVKELSDLNEIGRSLFSSIKGLLSKVDRQNSLTEENISSQLKVFRQKLVNYMKGVM